jgi:uncharacterized protein YndB with AHSA1/START domain
MSRERFSDESVRNKTGRGWDQWFRILDRWDATEKGHKATAAHLHEELGVDFWWAQTLTVQYERERGLRAVGQKSDQSWQLTVQRTIDAPVAAAWDAFTTAEGWNRWFTTKARVALEVGGRYSNADGDTGTFRRIDEGEFLRFTWDNPGHCPGTLVEVRFTAKGPAKCTVGLMHSKIADEAGREDMKQGWTWAMSNLKSWLERGEVTTFEAWQAAR